MKRQMTRACAGLNGGERRIVGSERTLARVEFVNEHLIESEVTRQRETIGGVRGDVVRMRPFLSLRIGARPFVLNERGRFAELAIAENGQHLDAATAVIGHEDKFA